MNLYPDICKCSQQYDIRGEMFNYYATFETVSIHIYCSFTKKSHVHTGHMTNFESKIVGFYELVGWTQSKTEDIRILT